MTFEAKVTVKMHPKQQAALRKIAQSVGVEQDPTTHDLELTPEELTAIRQDPGLSKGLTMMIKAYARQATLEPTAKATKLKKSAVTIPPSGGSTPSA